MKKQTTTLLALVIVCLFFIFICSLRGIWLHFLVWNLILALIPYAISTRLATYHQSVKRITFGMWLAMLLWLIFLPNTFCIITDYIHVQYLTQHERWVGLLTITQFAITGCAAGFISLRNLQEIVVARYSQKISVLFVVFVLFLSSIGIYLGRFLRFNSWELVSSPSKISEYTMTGILHLSDRIEAVEFVALFTVLLITLYFFLYPLRAE